MRDAVHLLRTKPARRNVVPIKEDARTPVRETDFEAARWGTTSCLITRIGIRAA